MRTEPLPNAPGAKPGAAGAKPGVVITGATGFLGSRLASILCEKYTIYAIARHSALEHGMLESPDVRYFRVDVADFEPLREAFCYIDEHGGADILLHMAGFYDFTGDEHPEYYRTNVVGTRNVLELSQCLHLKKFFFTSSIAACPFPRPGDAVTEDTPPLAPPPYSRSKQKGEEMCREYRDRVPTAILRLAAIFSNWCEYEPLYNFLETWLGGGWDARVLGGRGQWGIPYLHVRDLIAFFLSAVERCDELQPLEVLQAAPDGCTSMLQLYRQATRHTYGAPRRYLYVPKLLARFGIGLRLAAGRVIGRLPFERSWMGEYIDWQLNVDASRTHRRLGWKPSPELDILNCVPTMLVNRKTNPAEWRQRYERSRKSEHRNGRLATDLKQRN